MRVPLDVPPAGRSYIRPSQDCVSAPRQKEVPHRKMYGIEFMTISFDMSFFCHIVHVMSCHVKKKFIELFYLLRLLLACDVMASCSI